MYVSAVFLEGFTFKQLKELGLERPAVCFEPDDELWMLFGSCPPAITQDAFKY